MIKQQQQDMAMQSLPLNASLSCVHFHVFVSQFGKLFEFKKGSELNYMEMQLL